MTTLALTLTLALLAAPDEAPPPAEPTRPTSVRLDFRGRTVAEVARALGERSGDLVQVVGGFGPEPEPITLVAPEPVPLWEAVDRLCAEGKATRHVMGNGLFRNPAARVQLQPSRGPALAPGSSGPDPGPAQYVGPLRIGQLALHAHFDQEFAPGPKAPGAAEVPPFYAEFQAVAEPRVIVLQTGPPRRLEAVDDLGQSLLGPTRDDPGPSPGQTYNLHNPTTIRVALARPERPGTRLTRLAGVLPVEVGLLPAEPTATIPLKDSAGRTFRAGAITVRIVESKIDESGTTRLTLFARIEGERGDRSRVPAAVLYARLMSLVHDQMELVDERGASSRPNGGGSWGPVGDEIRLEMTYTPFANQHGGMPAQLRVFAPAWTAWDAPFAFGDLPLPWTDPEPRRP